MVTFNECRYTAASGDTGDFDFRVGTATYRHRADPQRACRQVHPQRQDPRWTPPPRRWSSASGQRHGADGDLQRGDLDDQRARPPRAPSSSMWREHRATDPTVASYIFVTGKTATLVLSDSAVDLEGQTATLTLRHADRPPRHARRTRRATTLATISGGLGAERDQQHRQRAALRGGIAESGYYADEALTTKLTAPIKVGANFYFKSGLRRRGRAVVEVSGD